MVEADYQLTASAPEVELSLPLGGILRLESRRDYVVGHTSDADIRVVANLGRAQELGWGGRKNHGLCFRDGHWEFQHFGHGEPIAFNGVMTSAPHRLETGDRVSPALGVEFTFARRDELARYAEVVALERDAPAAYPVQVDMLLEAGVTSHERAARILAALVARWRFR